MVNKVFSIGPLIQKEEFLHSYILEIFCSLEEKGI